MSQEKGIVDNFQFCLQALRDGDVIAYQPKGCSVLDAIRITRKPLKTTHAETATGRKRLDFDCGLLSAIVAVY